MKKIILTFLLFSDLVAAQIHPADGFWRTSDDPEIGSGLLITTQGDVTLVSIFTYDEQGKNSWYIATDQIDGNGLFEADLYQTQNGSNIVASDPQSASTINTGERIKIQFSGNQMGELTVGNSGAKSIQTFHFGLESWQTEHQTLPDGTLFTLPALDGVWVVGAVNSNVTWVFDLQYDPILSDGWLTAPYQGKVYLSQHPSTRDWAVTCPWKVNASTDPVTTPFCTVYSENFENELFTINYTELGAEKMLLRGNPATESADFEAFRVNSQSQVHNGHWRTHDDPAVGSGLYLVTQGNITLALLYSYQQQGTPEWGIATGQIDASGVFQAELLMPTGGKPFYFGTPSAATLMEETKSLTLSFQGAEVGTISIEGSEPKTMQRFNYGVELFETEQIQINGTDLKFPDQSGRWVVIDNQFELFDTVELTFYNPNCCISPEVPWYDGARGYNETLNVDNNPGDFGLGFICTVITEGDNGEEYIRRYCDGHFGLSQTDFTRNLKLYFEDIGVNSFKAYFGESSDVPAVDINRDSNFLTFYRID